MQQANPDVAGQNNQTSNSIIMMMNEGTASNISRTAQLRVP